MNNAVLYIRVSTDEQAKYGYSIDMQQTQCGNFARKEGYTITKVYIDDGYTARNENRPRFKELLTDIKNRKNGIDAVIVWRCDRIVRNNSLYHSRLVPEFAKYGVALLSATENNDVNTPYGRYIRNNQINNAELESELTSIRTKENLKEKARQGYFPGSIPPVGYYRPKVSKKENRKNIIIPDPAKKDYVKEVFRLYTNGYSYKDIANTLAKRGFTHNNKPCSHKLVENILTVYYMFYIGKFRYKGDIYDGKHEPILTIQEYAAFKAAREANYKPKKIRHEFLYKGLITCPNANRLFVGELQHGKNKSGDYEYYRCHHKCPYYNNCKRVIKAEVIDKAVLEAISSIDITEEKFNDIREELKGIMYHSEEFNNKRQAQVEAQLTKLKNRLSALYDDKIDGIISEEVYINKRDAWQNQIDDFMIELTAICKTQREVFKRIETMLELCKDLTGAYLKHTDEKKRILLKMLCSNFFYDGSKVVITIKEPFKALMNFAIFKNGAHGGSLLELFTNVIYPVFNTTTAFQLHYDIEAYHALSA